MNPRIGSHAPPAVARVAGRRRARLAPGVAAVAWFSLLLLAPTGCRARDARPDAPHRRAFSAQVPQAAVLVRSDRGVEQGVDTEYGVLFLGRTVRSGPCEVTFYVSGESFTYPGTVQSGSGTVALVSTPFVAQQVAVAEAPVRPGELARVAGLKGGEFWKHPVTATRDDAVFGNIVEVLAVDDAPPLTLDQLSGAGIYVWREERWRLAGIATEVLEWRGPSAGGILSNESPRELGKTTMMLLYAGPQELGMAATLPREYFERREKVYDPRIVR